MTAPVILAVDDDPASCADVERELRDRYARHYRVRGLSSAGRRPGSALEELAAAGEDVALVLAASGSPALTGTRSARRGARTCIRTPSAPC